MRRFLTIIFILACYRAKSQPQLGYSVAGDGPKTTLTAELGIPFGKIAKLNCEIYNGNRLHMKVYEDAYLLKIISVDDKIINKPTFLPFTDETGTLANEDLGLYQLIYKKKAGSLTEKQVASMQKRYVGKKLTLMAYETGQFRGMPKNYFKDKPRVDVGFCFQHNLVVVSNLTPVFPDKP